MNNRRFHYRRILIMIVIYTILFIVIRAFFAHNTLVLYGRNEGLRFYTHNIDRQVNNQNYVDIDFHDINSEDEAIYHNYLNRVIMHNWKNPLSTENVKAEIQVIINRNGKISSYQISKSSGNNEYDNQALKAIMDTSPFQPFYGNMQGGERLFTFYFNGSRAGANGYTYRMAKRDPLEISIDQSSQNTQTPNVTDVKRARISFDRGYFPCATEIYDKWRPNLTQNSVVNIDFRLNEDGSIKIKNIENNNNKNAVNNAVNALNNAKCSPLIKEKYIDVHYSFIVEDYKYSH